MGVSFGQTKESAKGYEIFNEVVKRSEEAVGIWTEEHWDMKRVNSLYTMVSRRLNLKINKRFDSLSWSSVVRELYTKEGLYPWRIK